MPRYCVCVRAEGFLRQTAACRCGGVLHLKASRRISSASSRLLEDVVVVPPAVSRVYSIARMLSLSICSRKENITRVFPGDGNDGMWDGCLMPRCSHCGDLPFPVFPLWKKSEGNDNYIRKKSILNIYNIKSKHFSSSTN